MSRLKKARLPTTAHGMRALVGTVLEEAEYSQELIHAVLSHAKDGGDKTTAAYMRSSMFEARKECMALLGKKIMEELAKIDE